MKRYRYRYESRTSFSTAVTAHSFLLRAVPRDDASQTLEESYLSIYPQPSSLSWDNDAWGSRIDYGFTAAAHAEFGYVSSGVVSVKGAARAEAAPALIYTLPSPMAGFTPEMEVITAEADSEPGSMLDRALTIASQVYESMEYRPGCTDADTLAGAAFSQRAGVCQDFAHVMIAICRRCGIPARYICGFVVGEGETHAWVEVWNEGYWHGIDPTTGLACDDRYIVLAYGRDVKDCPVNRGLFNGNVIQQTVTKVIVEEIKDDKDNF